MSHSVTGKLNKAANSHNSGSGTTFFIRLGQQSYNFKTKQKEWANFEAAVFAKESQVGFYQSALIEGAIVTVSGTSLIVENDSQYGVKLHIQDARIEYIHNPQGVAVPNPQAYQQPQAPQQAPQMQPQQQAPTGLNPANVIDSFDDDLPF